MAKKSKGEIKLNKNHQGKEFSNSFHIVGLVKPVRKKDNETDNWFDVEIYDTNKTKSNKDRRVTQFIVETANRNELKVEVAGMEQDFAYIYSSVDRKSVRVPFSTRKDKSTYPNDTYHLIDTDWDKAEKIGEMVTEGMWADVKGKYEFSKFTNDEGKEITSIKRIIEQVTPLKNGEITITGLKEGDVFRAFDSEVEGTYLGMGKADKEGVAKVRVGWLNPEGGTLYITKMENDVEGKRVKLDYTDGTVTTDRITVSNNVDSSVRVDKQDGSGYEYITYVRNFRSEDFVEINKFEMQLGIRSTYQDSETLDTKINGVFLSYGKERSTPNDVDLTVYHKETEEGKDSLATAFSRLLPNSFLVVEGVDNNRAETALVEVQEKEDDNPFLDVAEKTIEYVQVSAGTKKGLEVLRYVQGTYIKELLTDEEITSVSEIDPFASNTSTTTVTEDQLPF